MYTESASLRAWQKDSGCMSKLLDRRKHLTVSSVLNVNVVYLGIFLIDRKLLIVLLNRTNVEANNLYHSLTIPVLH